MPTINENKDIWQNYDWKDGGDEWSAPWGSSLNLWHGAVMPRISHHLPCESLLEIAPGYGRVTQYLLAYAHYYTGVDLASRCVEHCQNRFGSTDKRRFIVNDGTSLAEIEDGSIDFAFSWDSLVHADPSVLRGYAHELARKLKPGGRAFLHHSNAAGLGPDKFAELADNNVHKRDLRMSAGLFREFCAEAGLVCVAQELIAWIHGSLTDAFSHCMRPESGRAGVAMREPRLREHYDFMAEAINLRQMSELARQG